MKSLYQTKEFATYWNVRAGKKGEAYKRYVLDPAMFKLVGPLKHKQIIELGCGNGYLASKFLKQKVTSLSLVDGSEHNLEFAREKSNDPRVVFLKQDITKKWKIKNTSTDVIYSNMVFNEVKNISKPFKEAYRVLKKGGCFVFSVTHPAWDLFIYAQEKAGLQQNKIKGLKGYFDRSWAHYIMNGKNKGNPNLLELYPTQEFKVAHFHRPLQDYFQTLVRVGFTIKNFLEPALNNQLIKRHPRFKERGDYPASAIFYCVKK